MRKMPFGAVVRGGKPHIYFGVKAGRRVIGGIAWWLREP